MKMKRYFCQTGQIALVVLLVMVVMLTLGITIAQRGLFDVKLSVQEEEASRAFQAAETGVEEALRTLAGTPEGEKVGFGTDTEYAVTVAAAGEKGLVTAQPVAVGETLAVDAAGTTGLTGGVDVYFIDTLVEDCDAVNVAAIEVAVVRAGGVVERSVFDVNSARTTSNGFTAAAKGAYLFQNRTFCGRVNVSVASDAEEIRVRPFYNLVSVGVNPRPDGATLAAQYRVIRSQGETESGVTRVVEVQRGNPQVPGIFDYVLFSGGDLAKAGGGAGIPLPSSPPTPPPVSGWWDTNWGFRRPVTVNSGAAQTNYQVQMTFDTAAIIAAGKMQTGCQDIRFIDDDDTTGLNFWLESGCNTTTTRMWVRLPQVPAGGKTISVYYGNSGAPATSSLVSTFDQMAVLDDFSGGWKYSGTSGGKLKGWQDELTQFSFNDSGFSGVTIASDYVSNCNKCHWFVRSKDLFIRAGEIRYSGDVDDDEVWTLIHSSGSFSRIGGDENDNSGSDAHSWTNRSFTVGSDGRYIWAGRGNEGGGGDWLRITTINSGLGNMYSRKQVLPEPTASVGSEEERP